MLINGWAKTKSWFSTNDTIEVMEEIILKEMQQALKDGQMGKFGIFNKLRELIAVISFSIFLWAVGLSEDEYFISIYEQEQALKEE